MDNRIPHWLQWRYLGAIVGLFVYYIGWSLLQRCLQINNVGEYGMWGSLICIPYIIPLAALNPLSGLLPVASEDYIFMLLGMIQSAALGFGIGFFIDQVSNKKI